MPQHGVRDEHADRVDCDVLRPAVAAAPVAAAAKSAATVAAALAAAALAAALTATSRPGRARALAPRHPRAGAQLRSLVVPR